MYAANAVLNVLNDTQRHWLLDLAYTEIGTLNKTFLDTSSAQYMGLLDSMIYGRLPLYTAFRQYSQVLGNRLNKNKLIVYSQKMYALDAHITIKRVRVFARVLNSLIQSQYETLSNFGCMLTFPNVSTDTTWNNLNGNYVFTLYQTYAGELLA